MRGRSSILWIVMKTSQSGSEKQKSSKPWLAVGIGLALLFIVLGGAYLIPRLQAPNYAADTAASIEALLSNAGGIKGCTRGDSGRGPDNENPWYEVYYSVPIKEADAVSLTYRVTSQEGYRLTHASIDNRGPVGVADQFIDKWYFDDTTKLSPYKDLKEGSIKFFATVNADGSDTVCSRKLKMDAANSVIGISIYLPDYK